MDVCTARMDGRIIGDRPVNKGQEDVQKRMKGPWVSAERQLMVINQTHNDGYNGLAKNRYEVMLGLLKTRASVPERASGRDVALEFNVINQPYRSRESRTRTQ